MKKSIFCLTLWSLICVTSCTLSNESLNEDKLSAVKPKDLMPAAISQVAKNQSAIGARISGSVVQYYQDELATSFMNNYRFSTDLFNNLWRTGFYGGSLTNLNEMKNLAEQESKTNIVSIANILMAHEYGSLTNFFGDIPLSEALQGANNITPTYDTQQEVYNSILARLDDAISSIGSESFDSNISEQDLIYGGNMQNWKKLAFALKARYLLNLTKRDQSLYPQIIEAIEQSFTSREEEAVFNFSPTFPNPLEVFGKSRPGAMHIGDYFATALLLDPRYDSFILDNNNFFSLDFHGDPKLIWTQENSSIPLFSFTELKFIKAEILHLMGSSVDETTMALTIAMQASFTETTGFNQDALLYIPTRANLNVISSSEARHERIMEEAYKAYYGYGHRQTFNNFRRTGYPVLSSTSNSPWEGNPSNIIPRRFPYPQSEFELNTDNINEAIARQGSLLLDEDIWIFR